MMANKDEMDLNNYLNSQNLANVRYVCKNISNDNYYAMIVNTSSDDSIYAICLKLDGEYNGPCIVDMYDNTLNDQESTGKIESIKRQLTRCPANTILITGNLVASNVRNESFVCWTDGILDTSTKLYNFATIDAINDGVYSKDYFVVEKRNALKRFYGVMTIDWGDVEINKKRQMLIEKIKLLNTGNQHVLLLQDSVESEILNGEREIYDMVLSVNY